jgi:hypothetical protein
VRKSKNLKAHLDYARDHLSVLSKAALAERDPRRRRSIDLANMMKLARIWPGEDTARPDYHHAFARWLLLEASPTELREIADALEMRDGQQDGYGSRINIIRAYKAALEKLDPRFRCTDYDLTIGGEHLIATSPLVFADRIKVAPTRQQVRAEFVRLFGERCCPPPFSIAKTIKKTFKLPLSDGKSGRPTEKTRRKKA